MECVSRFYANATPFYRRDVNFHEVWYPWGVVEPVPGERGGTIVDEHLRALMYLVLRNKGVLNPPDDQSSFCKRHLPEHHPEHLGKKP